MCAREHLLSFLIFTKAEFLTFKIACLMDIIKINYNMLESDSRSIDPHDLPKWAS